MPHIQFGDNRINIPADQVEALKEALRTAHKEGVALDLEVTDAIDGEVSWLYWTPGAPFVINNWDYDIRT